MKKSEEETIDTLNIAIKNKTPQKIIDDLYYKLQNPTLILRNKASL